MPNTQRKKIQLYRNETIYIPSEQHTALENAKLALSNTALSTLSDGEVIIGRYQETNQDVKTVIGIVHDLSNNEGITFFTNNDNLFQDYVRKPDVLYETDGTTGLLGVNQDELGNNWQLQNMDFTAYQYLRCYFKMGNFSTNGVDLTPSMVIELPLDNASKAKTANDSTQESQKQPCDMYIAGGVVPNPSDPTKMLSMTVAVDATKTKLQIINQIAYDNWTYDNNYGNSPTDANDNGRFLYKIEGCYDTVNNSSASALPSVTNNDNGKILMVVNGVWALVNPTTIYTGSNAPSNSQGNNGDLYLQTS